MYSVYYELAVQGQVFISFLVVLSITVDCKLSQPKTGPDWPNIDLINDIDIDNTNKKINNTKILMFRTNTVYNNKKQDTNS